MALQRLKSLQCALQRGVSGLLDVLEQLGSGLKLRMTDSAGRLVLVRVAKLLPALFFKFSFLLFSQLLLGLLVLLLLLAGVNIFIGVLFAIALRHGLAFLGFWLRVRRRRYLRHTCLRHTSRLPIVFPSFLFFLRLRRRFFQCVLVSLRIQMRFELSDNVEALVADLAEQLSKFVDVEPLAYQRLVRAQI